MSCCVLVLNGRVGVAIEEARKELYLPRKELYLPKEVFGADYMLPTKTCGNLQTKIIICFAYA
jgi:hypothetical protein